MDESAYKYCQGCSERVSAEWAHASCVHCRDEAKRRKKADERHGKKRKKKSKWKRISDAFYKSREWREVRYRALLLHGKKCMCCGATGRLHVDHVMPRSKYPALQLDINNLQVLCEDCNIGKGSWDETDHRPGNHARFSD